MKSFAELEQEVEALHHERVHERAAHEEELVAFASKLALALYHASLARTALSRDPYAHKKHDVIAYQLDRILELDFKKH